MKHVATSVHGTASYTISLERTFNLFTVRI